MSVDMRAGVEMVDPNKVRLNVYVTREAKRMLDALGEQIAPGLGRRDSFTVEQIIRQAAAQRGIQVDEPRQPRRED